MKTPISAIRRSEIVIAMYDAIHKDGISLPSFDQISQSGDMTRQLVRHYFSNSEEIAVGLCDMLADAYRECLMKGILTVSDGERLPVFLDFYFGFLSEKGLPKPQDDQVYDAMFAFASTSEPVRQNLHNQYSLLQMTLSHELLLTYPDMNQNDCRELGYLIVITMYGHWKMVATLGFDDSYNLVSRKAIDRLVSSYLNKTE